MGGSFARTGLPQPVTSTSYNDSNQLTQWGAATLSYDLNGNLAGDGVNTYEWDARNQLSIINSGASASFQYDVFGRRTSKMIGGAATAFLYDGMNIVQEVSGGTAANLLTGVGLDEVFSRADAAGTRYFMTDALGSTLALADADGNILTQYTYEPFGNTIASGQANANPYHYTSRENDGTGLYSYRARYYSPTVQRFISEDPIGFSGGVNLYAYALNDPLQFLDPLGLDPQKERECKDCGGHPKKDLDPEVAKKCCKDSPPMTSSDPNPYGPCDTHLGINQRFMFRHAGNNRWGEQVRGCLVCVYEHGMDTDTAHSFCQDDAWSRTSKAGNLWAPGILGRASQFVSGATAAIRQAYVASINPLIILLFPCLNVQ